MKKIGLMVLIIIYSLILTMYYNPVSYGYDNYVNEDIMGNIKINDLGIDTKLFQGLDDEYYMSHDEDGNLSGNSVIFLGYETDLNMKKPNVLYIPYEKVMDNIDKLYINYLGNDICYYVTNKGDYDRLIIKYYFDNRVVKTMSALRCQ